MGTKAKVIGLVASVGVTAIVAGTVLGASAVTSSNVDVVKKTSANVNLASTAGTNTTIVQVTVPAGAWVVTADVSVVNFGTFEYVRCGVYAGGTALGGHSAVVSSANTVADIATMGAIKSASKVTISLRCSHDHAIGGLSADAGAVLWAHKSASLALPG